MFQKAESQFMCNEFKSLKILYLSYCFPKRNSANISVHVTYQGVSCGFLTHDLATSDISVSEIVIIKSSSFIQINMTRTAL